MAAMRNLFRKPTEADKRAAAVRSELDAARAKLAEIDAGKVAAQADSIAFARWSAERNAATLEVDRVTGLLETVETDAEAARKGEADAAVRREIAAARKDAADMASRIKIDGPRIVAEFLQLTKDAARQALEAKRLNENLPDGEAPIPAADILARDFGAEPRRDLKSRTVALWVRESDGQIVGDQDRVDSADGVVGQFFAAGTAFRWKCVRREFRETEFNPAVLFDWPGSFHELIRLPRLDGPGLCFDGSRMTIEMAAALDVAALVKPAKRQPRPVQIELIPIDPKWPPAEDEAPTEADRNTV